MRRRTVRNGLRLVMVSLVLIILASFYHAGLSEMFLLSLAAENRFYSLGIFWAAAMGSYGVVLVAFGFILSPQKRDESIRILPTLLVVFGLVILFFYLLSTSLSSPPREEQRRLRPGETITI